MTKNICKYLRSEMLGSRIAGWVLDLVLDLDLDLVLRPGPDWFWTGLKTDLKNPISQIYRV